jgi:hypothetical protein
MAAAQNEPLQSSIGKYVNYLTLPEKQQTTNFKFYYYGTGKVPAGGWRVFSGSSAQAHLCPHRLRPQGGGYCPQPGMGMSLHWNHYPTNCFRHVVVPSPARTDRRVATAARNLVLCPSRKVDPPMTAGGSELGVERYVHPWNAELWFLMCCLRGMSRLLAEFDTSLTPVVDTRGLRQRSTYKCMLPFGVGLSLTQLGAVLLDSRSSRATLPLNDQPFPQFMSSCGCTHSDSVTTCKTLD